MSKPQFQIFNRSTQQQIDAAIARLEASAYADLYAAYLTGGAFFPAIPMTQEQIDDCCITGNLLDGEFNWSSDEHGRKLDTIAQRLERK